MQVVLNSFKEIVLFLIVKGETSWKREQIFTLKHRSKESLRKLRGAAGGSVSPKVPSKSRRHRLSFRFSEYLLCLDELVFRH